ncbi:aminotransferase class I/II-fold pyridoxal phosphate-dependent enzyme [Candidatus Poribacteria bacterium]|nr:aminotransferase class I/II-fold pyridoxal phosphate-dependent enzyme [Candidatus Poribacteria bacterium]
MNIPITKPFFSEAEEKIAASSIRSGWVAQGPKVAEFEEVFAEYVDAKYAVAVSSGTTALHLAMILVGVDDKDEVICPSYSFIATANSIAYAGAKPVFVDIDPETYNIDPDKIKSAITPKTKAIMPVHQIGLSADMDPIMEIARKHNLEVIEDAACAVGAEYKGNKIGSISSLSCFSFHPRKVITTGEGGMITTNSQEYNEKAKSLRAHGASVSSVDRHKGKGKIYEQYADLGYNYRMTDIQGGIGIEQMKKLEYILERRRSLAEFYNKTLADIDFIHTPYVPEYSTHTYQSYSLRLDKDCKLDRDDIIQRMADMGVSCRRGIPPIHLEPYYRSLLGNLSLPITENVSRRSFFLPLYPSMTDDEQIYVIDCLRKIIL